MKNKGFIASVLLLFLVLSGAVAKAQSKLYPVMFYNLENLFDTINDPDVQDEEFTPEGPKEWNSVKYWKKMNNLDRVFWSVASVNKAFPAVIGVSEIENRNVLEDLVMMEKMQRGNYRIVHYDSPDNRGVDVAFLYRPDVFKLEGSDKIPVKVPGLSDFKTRDIVTMWGTIEDEPFYFLVMHWPSRLGGQQVSEFKRVAAAEIVRRAVDSVRTLRPDTKVVLMGDMNDDPVDESMTEGLRAKGKVKELQPGDLFNPFLEMFKKGEGSLAYQDSWNLFDNMVVSDNLVKDNKGGLTLKKADGARFLGNIYRGKFLFQQEGQYKGYPLRTFVGNNFQGGYSDHLPVFILIAK